MIRYQPLALAVLTAMFTLTTNADEPGVQQKIKVLKEDFLPKNDWKNVGFKTPQATGQTFLWATREGDVESLLKCFDKQEQLNLSDEDKLRMQEAANAATGYQPLAIRAIDDNQVELKFKVEGWQEKPFVHQFKFIDGEWKIDSSRSTTTAQW